MSAPKVRAAVAGYLQSAGIANLTYLYAEAPFDLEDIPWQQLSTPGSTTDAVGIVFVDSDDDEVIGLDGAGGRRVCTYQVTVEFMVWDVSADPVVAQGAYDAMVAAVKFRLRTDPQLGTATTPGFAGNDEIIQAAVAQLQGEYGRPVRLGDGDAWACWFGIHFTVQTFEYAT